MPAGAFDHSGGDRPAAGQRGGVVQVVGLVGQVDGAGICSGSLSVVEPGDGRGPPDRPGDAGGLAVQDGAGVVAYPFLGGGVAFAVEAPCGLPDVLEKVNEVDHDGDLQGACVGLGGDPVDLVVVAVDEAHARTLQVTIVIDFIHVLEYIWKAAWCFHREGDPAAEEWVRHHARAVLDGKATRVAGAIRRAATIAGLHDAQRAGADACAVYLTNKAHYLDYPTALASGWPIATGVIEGACRHLVKDRMDLTGARWGLPGAEAILKLRAIASNGDFDDYWRHHLAQERHRVHETRYAQDVIPQAA